MSPMLKACTRHGKIIPEGGKCPECRSQPSTKVTAGRAHRKRREALKATLPAPCYFCGELVHADHFDAHHVSGTASDVLAPAHPHCNRSAGARGDDGPPPEAVPGPRPWIG